MGRGRIVGGVSAPIIGGGATYSKGGKVSLKKLSSQR